MYASVGKKRDQPQENLVIPSKRTEWQQPADILPPISKRLSGQRRRRVLGAFPETESDVSRNGRERRSFSFLSLHRKSAGVFYHNMRSIFTVRKLREFLRCLNDIDFRVGPWKVFTDVKDSVRFCFFK